MELKHVEIKLHDVSDTFFHFAYKIVYRVGRTECHGQGTVSVPQWWPIEKAKKRVETAIRGIMKEIEKFEREYGLENCGFEYIEKRMRELADP